MSSKKVSPPVGLASIFKKPRIVIVQAMNDELALTGESIAEIVAYEQIQFADEKVVRFGNEFIPVFDMRSGTQASALQEQKTGELLVFSLRNRRIGLLVTCVNGIFELEPLDIEPLPAAYSGIQYAVGKICLSDREILVIDMVRLLAPSLERTFADKQGEHPG